MKILYLTASGEIGGGNQSLLALWSGLLAGGGGVHAICPEPGPMVEACTQRGIPCDVVPYGTIGWLEPRELARTYGRWMTVLRRVRPALVHANAFGGARSVTLAARRLGLPLICHIRFPPEASYLRWVFRGLPKPDAFVFNSRALGDEISGTLAANYPRVKQIVAYNGIDLDVFQPSRPADHAPARIGIIANLSAIKGHEDFLAMARQLVDSGHRCEFWIIGTDITGAHYERQLAAIAERLDLTPHVRFLGFRSDVAQLIAQLDVVVSSSHYESFGRTLVEAMACERPVVATAVGGVPEVVEDGVTGLLVPPRNPLALADAVARLLQDAPARHRMGRAGRERATRLFSVEACVAAMQAIYRDLLTPATVPARSA